MNTTTVLDELNHNALEELGLKLSALRQQKGFTTEYVASKLHLRVRIIELIENSDFHLLPQPVFVKGYLRAYSKLLGISPEPFVEVFNAHFVSEKNPERALWQSRRETHKAEHVVRWVTLAFAVGVMVAVGIWWQKSAEDRQQPDFSKQVIRDLSFNQSTSEVKLTDISKMQNLLNPPVQMSPLEKESG
jgi:cytoskeleton protein RodZ